MAKTKTWQYSMSNAISGLSATDTNRKLVWQWSRGLLGDSTALTWVNENGSAAGTPTGAWTCLLSNAGTGTTVTGSQTTTTGSGTVSTTPSTVNITAIAPTNTAGFTAGGAGTFYLQKTDNTYVKVSYTNTSGNSFTGCTITSGSASYNSGAVVYDGVDRWTSTFTTGDIVGAAAGANHSWFLAVYNGTSFGGTGIGPIFCVLDFSSAGTNQGTWGNTFLSKNPPINVANPHQNAPVPTVNDQIGLATTGGQINVSNGNTTYHTSFRLSTDGIVRIIYSHDTVGYFEGVFRIDALTNTMASDPYPFAFYHSALSATNAGSSVMSTEGGNIGGSWTTGSFGRTNGGWRGKSFDGTTNVSYVPTVLCDTGSGTAANTRADLGANYLTNQANGKYDQIPAVGLAAITLGFSGFRGFLPDTWYAPGARGYLSGTAGSKTIQDAVFDPTNLLQVEGDFWEPAQSAHAL